MCGIAGIYSFRDKRPVASETLAAMGNTIVHRGPDDVGYLVDGHLGIVHRRLSIIDLVTGHQPMSNEDGNVWVAFNGEIYNYLELRTALQIQGHTFRTSSDTEVLVHLYEQWGEAALQKLNGMFAFAIWDKKRRRLFLARDRVGVKPLYYHLGPSGLTFGSEVKAILASGNVQAQPNYAGLVEYLTFQFCLGGKTLFRDIQALPPGHCLTVDEATGECTLREYWDLNFDDEAIDTEHDEDYFADRLLLLLEDSVRLELRSDVSLGCYVSGGMDSSVVSCLAAGLLGAGISTFSGAFREGPQYDETPYAHAVAEKIQSQHHDIYMTAQQFADSLPRLIYHMDEPAAGPGVFPQYMVSALARQSVKVVLSGEGGDEFAGGYMRYLLMMLEDALRRAMDGNSASNHLSLTALEPYLVQLRKYRPMLRSFWSDGLLEGTDNRYFRLIGRSGGHARLLSPELLRDVDHDPFEPFQQVFNRPKTTSLLNRLLYFDTKASLPALLQTEDRVSMAVSLETRVPLLDHRIMELMATVPDYVKMRNGQSKYLFKKAVRNVVPKAILERVDKMGFPMPTYEWFTGPLKGFVQDLLGSQRAQQRGIFAPQVLSKALKGEQAFGRNLWGLICLELWFETFIDQSASAAPAALSQQPIRAITEPT